MTTAKAPIATLSFPSHSGRCRQRCGESERQQRKFVVQNHACDEGWGVLQRPPLFRVVEKALPSLTETAMVTLPLWEYVV